MKGQVSSLEEVMRRVSLVTESMVEREGGAVGDWANMARELGNLSNNSIFRSVNHPASLSILSSP